jgi:two-component system, sensor histidine kinase and response regulator
MKNTVLIVEDSKAFAMSVEAALRQEGGYEVLLALNYAEAVRMLECHSNEIFVAITDLTLPDAEDGAAAKLMADNDIPSVAFTGNFSPNLRELVLNLGVSDYVLKNGHQDISYVVQLINRMSSNRNMEVLVVDDAPSSRDFLKALLHKQCFKVSAVGSAEEALDLLDQGHRFKVILVDLIMNGMDGFELLGSLRSRFDMSQMSIIGVSGKASSDQIAQFMKHGGNDFLLKPFQQEQVCSRVNSNAQLLDQFEDLGRLNQQKNELLGMAAHDIRGPLGVILSATGMLKREVTGDYAEMLLGLALEAAESMEELLDRLLDVSSVEDANISITIDKVNLCELLKKVVTDANLLAADKQQHISLELPVEPVIVEADSMRIKEVVHNLISNAVKYSQPGAKIEVRLSSNHKKMRIEVVDEAGGVPKEEQHLLFQPFCNISTKPTAGERSTGLGLSICQRIVKLHDGEIKYRANRQVGSIFEVSLPCISD